MEVITDQQLQDRQEELISEITTPLVAEPKAVVEKKKRVRFQHAPNRSAQVDRQEELISEITTPLVTEPKAVVEKKKRVRPTKAQALEVSNHNFKHGRPRVTADDRCHSCLRHDELLVDRLCGVCYKQLIF